MSAHPCPKCGQLRKVDIIHSSDGWHQPPCYHCGDPGYIESILPEEEPMICGVRTFIPDIGQHRFCTMVLGSVTNPNHDMPGPENKLVPHRSGEWIWATE